MAEHYSRNTTAVLKYCPTCNRNTMHKVSGKRIGLCTNSHVKEPAKKKETPDNNQGDLF